MQAADASTTEWEAESPESPARPPQPGGGWWRDSVVCLLLGLLAFLVYNANLRSIGAGDTYPARYLPLSIWKHHSLALDPIETLVAQGMKAPTAAGEVTGAYWMTKGPRGHLVSLYPVVTPVVLTPLYLPAFVYLQMTGWESERVDHMARIMEKICASLMASASVMLMYLVLRRRCARMLAIWLTLVYAFGTATWGISSQALWMHGLAQLLVVLGLWLITGPSTRWRTVAMGLVCALIACNRPPDVFLAAGLGLCALWWAGRRWPLLLLGGLAPTGLLLAYNLDAVGHLLGSYGLFTGKKKLALSVGSAFSGVAGLLFSPVHGLLVFSPFLLFLPFGWARVRSDPRSRRFAWVLGIAVLAQLLFYGAVQWVQGVSWGPRFLTAMLPILMWMLAPVVVGLSRVGRTAFSAACVVAVLIEVLGAFWYTGETHATSLAALSARPGMSVRAAAEHAAWDIRNTPFIADLRLPNELGARLRGTIDVATVTAGREVEVAGWALMGGHSPFDLHLLVDGQRRVASTGTFFERPDVVRALGEASPSGWRVTFPLGDLAPGEHVLTVLVRSAAGAQPRVLPERRFTVPPRIDEFVPRDWSLAQAAQHVAAVLAHRQHGSGYWLTAHTQAPRFERPVQELNLFANAEMIDVLGPVAQEVGVGEMLARARSFLASQIEDNGLVRYHGRPELPTHGTLGCRITPDADDTALVWRIAPGERAEGLAMALATLNRFRTPDGLYRTWLAPQDRYECLDPGKDPNPPDIGIQIHVFLLLAQADPPAARRLCQAMRKRASDESLWVYYKMAPPVVVLRRNELRQAGCSLDLPPQRLRTTVAGQGVWLELLERLQGLEDGGGASAAVHAENAAFLARLASGGFGMLARDPLLFYHNDLSASVSRFYWSQELGYALWLRLYAENERARTPGPERKTPEQGARP